MKNGFICEVTDKEVHEFLDEIEKRRLSKKVGLLTQWGCIIPEGATIVVELGKKNYISTINYLQRNKNNVFVRLITNGKKVEMPAFDDIFNVTVHKPKKIVQKPKGFDNISDELSEV